MDITLSGKTYEIRPPVSFALREDLVGQWSQATQSNAIARRTFGLALALCCPDLKLPKPRAIEAAYGGDLLAYGRECYDTLREAGHSAEEIAKAAGVAFNETAAVLFPRREEADAAVDFSEAGGEQTA